MSDLPIEHEAKFLNINKDEMRTLLNSHDATCKIPERLMRRAIIDYPDKRLHDVPGADQWIRVRDEGNRTTLTYKFVKENAAAGANELEVQVSDFDTTIAIFEAIGLQVYTRVETKRETWQLEDVEVVIDEWPFIPPFIEIEGPSEERVREIAEHLGFDWADAKFGTSNVIYRLNYPKMTEDEVVGEVPKLTFDMPMPQWLKDRM